MRILILFNKYTYRGGEDTYVKNLMSLLRKKGHSVRLFKRDSREIKNAADSLRAGIGLFWNGDTQRELTKLIKTFRPDVAHFHNIYPLISPTAYWVCKKYSIPIVQTIHNYKFMCPKNSLYRNGSLCELCVGKAISWPSILYGCYHDSRLSSLVYSCAFFFHKCIGTFRHINHYIFPTEFTKRYYVKNIPFVQSKQSSVLPSPTLIPSISKPERRKGPYLFVGRLSEEKGINGLVSLFRTNGKSLTIVGNGPLRNRLMVDPPSPNIRFIPHSSSTRIKRLMQSARALIVPSLWYEVLPLVILEAMALGKTIFLSGNKNLLSIQNRGNVIYFKPGDFDDLQEKIYIYEKLSQSPKLASMSEIYSPHYHYLKLKEIYEKIA